PLERRRCVAAAELVQLPPLRAPERDGLARGLSERTDGEVPDDEGPTDREDPDRNAQGTLRVGRLVRARGGRVVDRSGGELAYRHGVLRRADHRRTRVQRRLRTHGRRVDVVVRNGDAGDGDGAGVADEIAV